MARRSLRENKYQIQIWYCIRSVSELYQNCIRSVSELYLLKLLYFWYFLILQICAKFDLEKWYFQLILDLFQVARMKTMSHRSENNVFLVSVLQLSNRFKGEEAWTRINIEALCLSILLTDGTDVTEMKELLVIIPTCTECGHQYRVKCNRVILTREVANFPVKRVSNVKYVVGVLILCCDW